MWRCLRVANYSWSTAGDAKNRWWRPRAKSESRLRRACVDWRSESLRGIDKGVVKLPRLRLTAGFILFRTRNSIVARLVRRKRRSEREAILDLREALFRM